MADTEMQKAQAASQAGAELQEKGKDVSQLLSAFGGFNAIRGFMPDALEKRDQTLVGTA